MSWLNSIGLERLVWGRPAPVELVVAAGVAVLLLSLFLYRRQKGLPGWMRWGLASMRVVVLLLVLLALCEPMLVVKRTREIKRLLPVLVDVSKSMSIRDQRKNPEDVVDAAVALGLMNPSETGDLNRASLALDTRQREAIAAASRVDLAGTFLSGFARPVFDELSRDLDISYHVFGTSLRMLAEQENLATNVLTGLLAGESGTSIADSLQAAARSGKGAPLAGIVLLTDGLDTSSKHAESVLRDLGVQGIPVYPVPIGLADPDDVSIRNVVMQDVAFSGDKVPVRVQLQSKGYEKRAVELVVRLNGRSVAQRTVRLTGGLQFVDIFFSVDQHEKGAVQVEIAVEPFSDEATVENNGVKRSVRVVNEKIRVLCIEGSARWEYRYLMAMLKRDPRISVTFIAALSGPELARNSSEYIARFPERREDAFAYDLVILGDVDAGFFTGDEMLRLEELVRDRGGSLLMLCGPRFAPSSYAGTPVEKMLPVVLEPGGGWVDVNDAVHPVLTPEGRSSLVMTLETDQEENDLVWSRVAPLNSIPPIRAARPGATVLARLSDRSSRAEDYPLVAWQRYGTGKCMLVGTDRLWLLRFKTGDKYHWRVWSQYIQFLTLSRLMGEHKQIRIETDRVSYPVAGRVQLYAHVLDKRYDPVMQAGFEVMVQPDEPGALAQRVLLRPDAAQAGIYEGHFSPQRPGRYRVEANSGDANLSNTAEFQVTAVEPELLNTDMQLAGLQRIAELTGGKCLELRNIGELRALLHREPAETTYTAEVPLWDAWLVLILLIVLMGAEWIARRRRDLA